MYHSSVPHHRHPLLNPIRSFWYQSEVIFPNSLLSCGEAGLSAGGHLEVTTDGQKSHTAYRWLPWAANCAGGVSMIQTMLAGRSGIAEWKGQDWEAGSWPKQPLSPSPWTSNESRQWPGSLWLAPQTRPYLREETGEGSGRRNKSCAKLITCWYFRF